MRHAFSLIETAIVLGVVGLVIGSIWVAAAAVREQMIVNDIVNGFLRIKHNIEKQIPANIGSVVLMGSAWTPGYSGVAMGMAPQEWVNGSLVFVPTGQLVTASTFTYSGLPFAGVSLAMSNGGTSLPDFPVSLCIKILPRLLATDPRMLAVINGNMIYAAPSNTRSLEIVTSYCKGALPARFAGFDIRFPLALAN